MPADQWQNTDDHVVDAGGWQHTQDHTPSRGGRGGGATGQAAPEASKLNGNALTDFIGGVADTTVKTIPAAAKLVYHGARAAMGPPTALPSSDFGQDISNMANAQVDQGRKAKEAWKRGDHVEAIGHGAAAALPVVGPAAADAGETIGGELEYGDEQHPERATGVVREPQVARGIGQGAGLVGATVAPEVARGVANSRPVAAISDGVSDALQTSAEKQYGRVLGATTKPNKVRSTDVIQGYDNPVASAPGTTQRVPGLLERGTMAVTRKGLAAKATANVQDLGAQLESEWAKIPGDQGVPAADVYAKIDAQLKGEFMQPNPSGAMSVTSPHAATGYAFGQSLKKYMKAHEIVDANGQTVIPLDSIRTFRKSWDDLVASKNGYAGADLTNQAKTSAYKSSANGLRNILNSQNPTIEAINGEYSFWKDAERVIGDTNLRTSTQAKPLGSKIAKGVGQAVGYGHGGPLMAALGGEAMTAVEATINSPAWQTVSAVAKSRLADALASGNAANVMSAVGQIQRGSSALGQPASPDDIDGLASEFQKRRVRFPDLRGPGQVR